MLMVGTVVVTKQNKFIDDIKRGKIGEQEVILHLSKFPNVDKIYDVSGIKEFQDDDVDIIIKCNNGVSIFGEIKTDYMAHHTGIFPYELVSNSTYDTVGCLQKTKSDVIYFYLIETNELYHIRTNNLRKYMQAHINDFKKTNMGDNAVGYLIPLKILKEKEWCIKSRVKK